MNRRQRPLIIVLLGDILLSALILAVFAVFMLGLPTIIDRAKALIDPQETYLPAEPVKTVTAPVKTETEPFKTETEPVKSETEPEQTETEQTEIEPVQSEAPDERTPWQITFAEHFSPELEIGENFYRSPTVSVTVETVETVDSHNRAVVYHVADIYIADMSCFVTWTANNELKYFSVQDVATMDAEAEAILSMSGDFYSYQGSGFIMRNSVLYMNDRAYCDICVLFEDGTMGCYSRGEYTNDEIVAAGAVQIWNFGPTLLDKEGRAKENFDVMTTVGMRNPRSAVGYFEPGHYCFIMVDGRQEASAGMTLPELAAVFEQLGCTAAYNLDGGGSAVMLLNHERVSMQSNGNRALGDILVIKESEAAK